MSGIRLSGPSNTPIERGLQLIADESRTGIMELTATGTVTLLHFRDGSLVNAERVAGRELWPLGDYLVESGLVRPRQLVKAVDLARSGEIAPEDVLVRKRLVSENVVKRFAELQLAELVYPLFLADDPILRFLQERPRASRFITPVPAAFLLKEGRRRKSVWPDLRDEVGKETAVYTKEPRDLALLLGYEPAEPDFGISIGGQARIAFYAVNGKRTLAQVARTSGLGLFQTYEAFRDLIREELLVLVNPNGEGERRSALRPYLYRVGALLSYGIFGLLITLGVMWATDHGHEIEENVIRSEVGRTAALQRADLERVRELVHVYQLGEGQFPASLKVLVEQGYASDLLFGHGNALDYKLKDGRFILKRTETKR